MTLLRLRITYTLGTSGEVASNSFWFTNPNLIVAGDAATVSTPLQNLWDDTLGKYATGTRMALARLDVVSETTKRTLFGFDVTTPTTAASGGANRVPLQCSPVASLRTGTAGPSGRGRVYLPPPSTTQLDADGFLSDAIAQDLANGVAGFLNDMKALAYSYQPVVWSPTDGVSRSIIQVSVDDVLDTQRSRTNRLVRTRKNAVVN